MAYSRLIRYICWRSWFDKISGAHKDHLRDQPPHSLAVVCFFWVSAGCVKAMITFVFGARAPLIYMRLKG